eukprot:1359442-Alexandrium_andersonii.AAC.1
MGMVAMGSWTSWPRGHVDGGPARWGGGLASVWPRLARVATTQLRTCTLAKWLRRSRFDSSFARG